LGGVGLVGGGGGGFFGVCGGGGGGVGCSGAGGGCGGVVWGSKRSRSGARAGKKGEMNQTRRGKRQRGWVAGKTSGTRPTAVSGGGRGEDPAARKGA